MYRALYAEIADEDPGEARRREAAAFDRVIAGLEAARRAGPGSALLTGAIDAAQQLWAVLLHDLARSENALPEPLRAQLISVGLWIMRDIARLRASPSDDLEGLIAVNQTIRAGLR